MTVKVQGNLTPKLKLPILLLCGLDSLYVSYFLSTGESEIDFDELAYRKERARGARTEEVAAITLGSETFALRPFGRHPYTYVLTGSDFEISLAEHMQPTCYVRFSSVGLWLQGLDELSARFERWCQSLGLRVLRPEVVSRADWAFDYCLPTIDFTEDHFLSRATKDSKWREHGRAQTFQFGKDETVVRVYDKAREIEQQSAKSWFFDLWQQREGVWRVEAQVRGERLRAAGIRTIDDLKALQNDLLRELATAHTSLRVPGADSNRSRWKLHPLWRAFVEDIAALPQTGLVKAIDDPACIKWRLLRQGMALYGSLKGVAALLQARDGLELPPTLQATLAALPALLRPHHNRELWSADVQQRVTKLELGLW